MILVALLLLLLLNQHSVRRNMMCVQQEMALTQMSNTSRWQLPMYRACSKLGNLHAQNTKTDLKRSLEEDAWANNRAKPAQIKPVGTVWVEKKVCSQILLMMWPWALPSPGTAPLCWDLSSLLGTQHCMAVPVQRWAFLLWRFSPSLCAQSLLTY